MAHFEKVKDCLSSDLQWYIAMREQQLQHINKIDRLKNKAVKAGDDDAALERSNELVQLRKDYAFMSGCIHGIKHALMTIAHYEEGIDELYDDNGHAYIVTGENNE